MQENYPLVLDRIKSTLIDSIILIVCMFIFTDILAGFKDVPNWVRMLLLISLFFYEPFCTAYGATLGNHKMNIRVRKNSDMSQRITIFQALIRYFFKIIFGWFSFVSIFISPKSRTFHDIICGSVMIKVK
jgi:uncharacterized RDD family membrane protein YckC